MSEHTPLTEGYCPTCQVDGRRYCMTSTGRDHPSRRHFALGWHAALAARTSTATADTGLRERVEALAEEVEQWKARAEAAWTLGDQEFSTRLQLRHERNRAQVTLARIEAVLDEYAGSDHPEHLAIRAILDATAAPTTDTGARDE